MKKFMAVLVAAICIWGWPVYAADFQKGLDAYQSGDYSIAIEEWQPLAEQGNSMAQYNLGLIYQAGHSVSLNYQQAYEWYSLAVKQNFAPAQNNFGVIYQNGLGVELDYDKAFELYSLSAEQGFVTAQAN